MTLLLAPSTRSAAFVATAGQTDFPVKDNTGASYPVLAAADLDVWLIRASGRSLLALSTGYSVTGVGQQAGAQVILAQGAQDGDIILIEGARSVQRQSAIQSGGPIPSEALNADATQLIVHVQELRRDADRALRRAGEDTSAASNLLPAGLANCLLGFADDGSPVSVPHNNLTIGTVTTAAPGSPAGAEITGSAPDQQLNLTIPAGGQDTAIGLAREQIATTDLSPYSRIITSDGTPWIPGSGPCAREDAAGRLWCVDISGSDRVHAGWFGALPGLGDCKPAFDIAAATGKLIYLPPVASGPGFAHHGYLAPCAGLVGDGYKTNGQASSKITFYNCPNPLAGAITTVNCQKRHMIIDGVMICASSWDAVTGCLGWGIDHGSPLIFKNSYISGFKKSNIFSHISQTASGPYVNGPFGSIIENVFSAYSGGNGWLCGYGANAMVAIGYEGKWNGCQDFGTAPAAPGTGDGFKVTQTADGADIFPCLPEDITLIGGDCSYNAGYGWNIDMVFCSQMMPGYAEHNLTNQARIGNIWYTAVRFSYLLNREEGLTNEQNYSQYYLNNEVYVGGKKVWPLYDFTAVANSSAADFATTYQNAPTNRGAWWSRSDDFTHGVLMGGNATPDDTAIDPATGSAVMIKPISDASYVGIGAGSRHLKIGLNSVRLPDLYRHAVATGWGAAYKLRGIGTAAPGSGTWSAGDSYFNSTPTHTEGQASSYAGWVCTSGGTPGTWRPYGYLGEGVKTASKTVAGLPAAGMAAGVRFLVTDSTVAASGNFGAAVAGGGAATVPVSSDGSDLRIG